MQLLAWKKLLAPLRESWALMKDPGVSLGLKFIPLVTFLYVLSPIDLVPDIFSMLGLLDDVGILLMGLALFTKKAAKQRQIDTGEKM